MPLKRENLVIQRLAGQVLAIVARNFGKNLSTKTKSRELDVVSTLDILLDKIIVQRITSFFPNDTVISEESRTKLPRGGGRFWVVDPLCGSMNAARGIKLFVTNISLVENNKVVAAWVMDHTRGDIIWSLGQRKIYRNSKAIPRLIPPQSRVALISFDWGYSMELGRKVMRRYANVWKELLLRGNNELYCWATSLAFPYVATGQVRAAIVLNCKSWDLLAGCFLIEQNGGIVTNFDGTPWNIHSRSLIMGGDKKIYRTLHGLVRKYRLQKIK